MALIKASIVNLRRDMPLPQWIKRTAIGSGGRDPLGMSRVAQWLTDSLLPGIITTTWRARYYALYPWILWHVREKGEADSFGEFRSAFQRREAAIAIATILDGESAPVGVDAATKKLSEAEGGGTVSVNFKVLPANPLGGFGQYYSGSLYKLGLTEKDEAGIDVLNGTMAGRLASAVQQTLSTTPYIVQGLFDKNAIRIDALEDSSNRLSLDAIGKPLGKREANLVTDLLFGFGEGTPSAPIKAQRRTLAQLLWTIKEYQKRRIPVERDTFEDQVLYWPVYFNALLRAHRAATPIEFPNALAPQTAMWRQFCLQCYLTLAVEGLLEAILQVLATKPAGAPLDFVAEDLARLMPKAMKQLTGQVCEEPRELLDLLGLRGVPDQRLCRGLRKRFNADHRLNEGIHQHRVRTAADRAAKAALLLALLYGKWRGETTDEGYLAVIRGGGGELSAPHVLPLLDGWLDRNCDWQSAILQMARLIAQSHDRVMYEKGRLESCWLEYDAGRYRRAQDYETYRRAPRLLQAAFILADLKLLDVEGEGGEARFTLTPQGESTLARALKDE